MQLKPGSRWRSAVCETEIVVTRSPKIEIVLSCGGHAMIVATAPKPGGLQLSSEQAVGTRLGKRFADSESGLEVLCSKAGQGSLTVDGRPMMAKEAKALPSSD